MSFAYYHSEIREALRDRAERERAAKHAEGEYRRTLVKERTQLINELGLMPTNHAEVPEREKKLAKVNKRIARVDKVMDKKTVRFDKKQTKKEKKEDKEFERAKKGLKKYNRREERERRARKEGKVTPRRAARLTFFGAIAVALAPVAIGIVSVAVIAGIPVVALRKYRHHKAVKKARNLGNRYREASRLARPAHIRNDPRVCGTKNVHLSPVDKVNKAIGAFGKGVKGVFIKGKQ